MAGATLYAKTRFFIALLSGFAVFFMPSRAAASEAGLFLSPAGGTFLVGSTFNVSVLLDTKGAAVNTVEVELSFPPDKIQLASPSVGSSLIQLWPAPPVFSNRDGKIYFLGGIPSPGIVTSQGVVLTLTFRVTGPGGAEIRFGDRTSLRANDGRGTDILGQKGSAFYQFQVPPPLGPAITSPSHPDPERWYRDPNPVFVWPKTQFADGYSYVIDRNPSGFPDAVSEGAHSSASFQDIENGTWYFHLRERAGGVWGGVSRYPVKIDDEMPASFRISVSPGARTANRNPILRFFTTDALSGFSHYELKVIPLSRGEGSEALFFEVTSPYQMIDLESGRYQVVIRAVDRAGNARDEGAMLTVVGSFTRFFSPEGIDLGISFVSWPRVLLLVGAAALICMIALLILWMKRGREDGYSPLSFGSGRDTRYTFAEAVVNLFRRGFRGGGPKVLLLMVLGLTLFGVSHFVSAGPEVRVSTRSILLGMTPSFGERGEGIRLASAVVPPLFMALISDAASLFSQAGSSKTLTAPTIAVAPVMYYPLDEVLYLEGAAPPRAKIDIIFEKSGSRPVRLGAESNSNGEWFFNDKVELANGIWMVRVRVASDPPSDWSSPRIIQSVVSGFIVGALKIKFVPVIFILSALFFVAFVLLGYSLLKIRHARTREFETELRQKDKRLAASLVEQDFSELRNKMVQELSHLDHESKEGTLSPDEEERRVKLLRELDEVKERVEKKIKEIV